MRIQYLSLSPLLLARQLEYPVDWSKYFFRSAPLEVEIGFGNGDFLVERALNHPDKNFLGFEIRWRPVKSTLRKIALRKLTNVRLVQIDAKMALQYFFSSQSIARVYTLFPYPWPKRRHEENRLFSTEILELMNNRLVANGEFYLVTDHEDFCLWVKDQSLGAGFQLTDRKIAPQFKTKFEKIWLQEGQKEFFELSLIKQMHKEISSKRGIGMKAFFIDDFDGETFHPQGVSGFPVSVKFEDFIFDRTKKRGMLLTTAVEEDFVQTFWIEIAPQDKRWSVHVAQGCFVVPTKGVQRALELVQQNAPPPA